MQTLFINKPKGKLADVFGSKHPISIDFYVDAWNVHSEATGVWVLGVMWFNEAVDDFDDYYIKDISDELRSELDRYCIDYVNTDAKHIVEKAIARQRDIDAETRMEQMYEDRRRERSEG